MLKIRFRHYRLIFHQKNEEKKCSPENFTKKTNQGGGGGPEGWLANDHTFPVFFFATFPYKDYEKDCVEPVFREALHINPAKAVLQSEF